MKKGEAGILVPMDVPQGMKKTYLQNFNAITGGSSTSPEKFMRTLKDQLDVGAGGNATGRNIHQKSLDEAVRMCNAVYALTIEGKTVEEAMAVYKGVI